MQQSRWQVFRSRAVALLAGMQILTSAQNAHSGPQPAPSSSSRPPTNWGSIEDGERFVQRQIEECRNRAANNPAQPVECSPWAPYKFIQQGGGLRNVFYVELPGSCRVTRDRKAAICTGSDLHVYSSQVTEYVNLRGHPMPTVFPFQAVEFGCPAGDQIRISVGDGSPIIIRQKNASEGIFSDGILPEPGKTLRVVCESATPIEQPPPPKAIEPAAPPLIPQPAPSLMTPVEKCRGVAELNISTGQPVGPVDAQIAQAKAAAEKFCQTLPIGTPSNSTPATTLPTAAPTPITFGVFEVRGNNKDELASRCTIGIDGSSATCLGSPAVTLSRVELQPRSAESGGGTIPIFSDQTLACRSGQYLHMRAAPGEKLIFSGAEGIFYSPVFPSSPNPMNAMVKKTFAVSCQNIK